MSLESLSHIACGILYDFAAFLTTRDKRITLSAVDDASPAAEAIQEFLALNGVKPTEPFFHWELRCRGPHPSTAEEALAILSSALRDDPRQTETWEANLSILAQNAGASPEHATMLVADFMHRMFGVRCGPSEPGSLTPFTNPPKRNLSNVTHL